MRIALAFAVCVGVVHGAVNSFDTCKGDVDAVAADVNARQVAGNGGGDGGNWKLANAKCALGKGWKGDSTATTSLNTGTDAVDSDDALLALWVAVCCEDCTDETYSDQNDAAQACQTASKCAAGQQAGVTHTAQRNRSGCEACAAKKFNTAAQLAADEDAQCGNCDPLAAGTCPAGQEPYCDPTVGGAMVCRACLPGTFTQTDDNSTTCGNCTADGPCAVGSGVTCAADGDGSDKECVACTDGFYNGVEATTGGCLACPPLEADCPKGKGYVNCSKNGTGNDAACTACADGFFSDVVDKTSACQAHKTCEDEGGVKTAGTAEADAECSPAMKIATGLTSLLAVLLLLL